jgi:hypothetical protein
LTAVVNINCQSRSQCARRFSLPASKQNIDTFIAAELFELAASVNRSTLSAQVLAQLDEVETGCNAAISE